MHPTDLNLLIYFQDEEEEFPNDDVTDTVIANLVYDETSDSLSTVIEEPDPKDKHVNPIFEAFKEANGVDDLYRIAEIWVNPPSYFGARS